MSNRRQSQKANSGVTVRDEREKREEIEGKRER